ncbi:MAG: Maf family protein, partial [Bacteroidaceae bacterium]|nr:Maf family protein [Bacteroidaceae bacterium]
MLENLQKYRIVLASASPRRKELLEGLGVDFEVRILPGIDESYPNSLKGEEIPTYISRAKAKPYLNSMSDNELVITADTIVYVKGEVLGKPVDESDARRMLQLLSGCTHQVITGVTLMTKTFCRSFAVSTDVTFVTLSDD